MQTKIKSCKKCDRLICTKKRWCPPCRGKLASYQAKRWAHRACVHSKLSDQNANRPFNPEDFITPTRLVFLKQLQGGRCVYCHTDMQTDHRRKPNGLTIERVNNKLAHTKHNIVLCCFRCNCVGGRGCPGHILQSCFTELLQKTQNRRCQTPTTGCS